MCWFVNQLSIIIIIITNAVNVSKNCDQSTTCLLGSIACQFAVAHLQPPRRMDGLLANLLKASVNADRTDVMQIHVHMWIQIRDVDTDTLTIQTTLQPDNILRAKYSPHNTYTI
eukprot:GHVN01049794.1.p1 GENE.GHVN01049794.1~~GHVN01049794.1.p1  ORF type:complete len:114 (-),score=3.06 GHVN01049794.1:37-378(-)